MDMNVKPLATKIPWAWADMGGQLMLVTDGGGCQVILCATKEMGVGKRIQPAISTRDPATGLLRPLRPDDVVAKLVEAAPRLWLALEGARQCIADAKDDAWGTDMVGDPEVPGGRQVWNRKEEYLFHIDAALGKVPMPKPMPRITALDQAWEKINVLGGALTETDSEWETRNQMLLQVLGIIEDLGGTDPAPKRKAIENERQRRQEEAHRGGGAEARG